MNTEHPLTNDEFDGTTSKFLVGCTMLDVRRGILGVHRGLFLSLMLMLSSVLTYGTHIRAAQLTYKRVSVDNLTFEFTLTGFTDTGSPVVFGDGIIDFGDGNEFQIDLEADSYERGVFIDKDNRTELYTIKITYTYNAPGVYKVSYREPNRNDEILNINNKDSAVSTPFYLEASLVIDPLIGANDSPVLNTFPVDFGFVGKKFTHNPWAWDAEGDSLVYRLIVPLQDNDKVVPLFQRPNDADFYLPPKNVNSGNESGNGPAVYKIDPFTGDLVWDAPGNLLQNSQGEFSEYNVAFMVEEWREIEGSWIRIGFITRDMQIIVAGQEIGRPDFQIPGETLLLESVSIQETITFQDPDGDPIKVEFFGEVFDLPNNPMTVSPVPGDFTNGPLSLTFEWTLLAEHARDRPYFVHLKITDDPADPELNPAVTYKTWILSFNALPDVITGLDDQQELPKFKLYPNPASEVLKWYFPPVSEKSRLDIFNSFGQQTISLHLTSNGVGEIDVSRFSPGIYLGQLSTENGKYQQKFIKK